MDWGVCVHACVWPYSLGKREVAQWSDTDKLGEQRRQRGGQSSNNREIHTL